MSFAKSAREIAQALDIPSATRQSIHRVALERLISEFGENDFILQPISTDNPLVSASLIAELNRHEIVRNQEGGDNMFVIRRVLGVCGQNESIFKYQLDQEPRKRQYLNGIKRINCRLEMINRLKAEDSENILLDKEQDELLKRRSAYELISKFIRPTVQGTIHPDGATESDNLPRLFDGWRMRGIYLRIAGPRKATKAGAWKRSAGAISINSVDHVNAEQAIVHIPSRTGTYGLTVRLVWGMARDMANKSMLFHDGVQSYRLVDGYSKLL